MAAAEKRGVHRICFRDKEGEEIDVALEIKFEKLTIKPSFGLKSKI